MCTEPAGFAVRVIVFWRCPVTTSSPFAGPKVFLGHPDKGQYSVLNYNTESFQILFSAMFILTFDIADQEIARVVKRTPKQRVDTSIYVVDILTGIAWRAPSRHSDHF
jgi:hypothetical protein